MSQPVLRVPWFMLVVGVALGYWGGSRLALELASASGLDAVFFIPAGITIAVLLRVERRQWWLVLLTAGIVELLVDLEAGLGWASVGFAAANMAEPLVGGLLVAHLIGAHSLDLTRLRHMASFVAGAALTAPVVGALTGALTDVVALGGPFWNTAWQWWLGDGLAVLVVGVALLALGSSSDLRRLRPLHVLGVSVVVVGAAVGVLTVSDQPTEFLAMPMIVVAAVVYGVRGVGLVAALLAATFAVVFVFEGDRLWTATSNGTALTIIKAQLGVFVIVALFVAAVQQRRVQAAQAEMRARAVLANERLMRSLFASVDEGICIAEAVSDSEGRPVDFRVVQANPQLEEMLGGETIAGKRGLEVLPELGQFWTEALAQREQLAGPVSMELSLRGTWHEVSANQIGRRGRFVLAFRDRSAQKLELDREREISTRLQEALLPERLVRHPGIEMAAHYVPASAELEVGGDWYDTFLWPQGAVGIMVGDVMGHGLEAAAAMGRLRAATAALATVVPPSPAALLEALESFVLGPNGTDFATAFCAVFDPHASELRYASAGHLPALSVTAEGTRWLDRAQSPPLTAIPMGTRHEERVRLAPDEMVVIYSDGLVERRGENLSIGLERLERTASKLADTATEHVARQLAVELLRPAPAADDVISFVARFAPTAERHTIRIAADPAELATLRAQVRDWLESNHVPNERQDDVVLAISEAASNAIEHAYGDQHVEQERPAEVIANLALTSHTLSVEVQDHGRWVAMNSNPDRDRGISIMQALADEYRLETSAAGTTVNMRFDVREPVA